MFYNVYGLVVGSAKSPAGWEFSSERFGRTPVLNRYPMVLPVDIPNTPNLTWPVTRPVAAGAQIDGFTATTRVDTIVQGEYTAQVTPTGLPRRNGGCLSHGRRTGAHRRVPTRSFLAEVK